MSWVAIDVILTIDVVSAVVLLQLWVWRAYNEPTKYLWFLVKHPNGGNVTYVTTATIAILLITRVGKDSSFWSVTAACAVVSTFLWWFINYTHRKAVDCFAEDCAEYLPDSCPECIFFRAGKQYGAWKKPIPEHEDCCENRREKSAQEVR